MFEKGLITLLASSLLLALVAVPLMLRKVPRNVVYGFRTRATLGDDAIWYEANAHFGRRLLVASLVTAAAAVVLSRMRGLLPQRYLTATLVALVAPLFVAIILTARFVRSLGSGVARPRP